MDRQLTFDSLDPDNEPSFLPDETTSSSTKEQPGSASFPERFIDDVDGFLAYCTKTQVTLTKTSQTMGRKHLQALNDKLSVKAEQANAYSAQEFYPYLHFILQLALLSRLLEVAEDRANPIIQPTERLDLYKQFTYAEKYCTLLETLWLDMDWDDFAHPTKNFAIEVQTVFARLRHVEPGRKWNLVNPQTEIGELLYRGTRNWQHLYQYFEWFGLWICEPDTEQIQAYYRKNAYFAKNITLTNWGAKVMDVLLFDRNLHGWNVPHRRLYEETNWMPGAPFHHVRDCGLSREDARQLEMIAVEDQSSHPFYMPFLSLFPDGSLNNALPRNQKRTQEGAYTFRVTFNQGVWRLIQIPGTCTMHELHHAILKAYEFHDDAHLYSFFMDRKKWSNHCIASPDDDFGHPDASKLRIDSIGLHIGQRFLYLFDYGDEWTFTVKVEKIDEKDTTHFTPQLIASQGAGPVQYF